MKSEEAWAEEYIRKYLTFHKDGYLVVPLPFKEDPSSLPSGYGMARSRLSSLVGSLSRKYGPAGLLSYDRVLMELLEEGILTVVEPNKPLPKPHHFIPHFAVVKQDSMFSKWRVVVDPSQASGKGKSLNSVLRVGPNLLKSLQGIILRIRLSRHILVGDIKKCFLQLRLTEEHKSMAMILWLKHPLQPPSQDNLLTLRFERLCFGFNCSPFLLNVSVKWFLEQHFDDPEFGPVAREIASSIYVDNLHCSVNSPWELEETRRKVVALFAKIGMNVREFCSDDPAFNNSLPPEDRGKCPEGKLLGLIWNSEKDEFRIPPPSRFPLPPHPTSPHPPVPPEPDHSPSSSLPLPPPPPVPVEQHVADLHKLDSKRKLLSFFSSSWDPLSYGACITIKARLVFKSIVTHKPPFNWDDRLPPSFLNPWREVAADLAKLHLLSWPRAVPIPITSETPLELLVFCDASVEAIAVVVYVRNGTASESDFPSHHQRGSSTHFLCAQSWAVPGAAGQLTVPKCEMLGLDRAFRKALFVLREAPSKLKFKSVFVYTDSQIAIYQLSGSSYHSQYVKNRVQRIRGFRREIEEDFGAEVAVFHVSGVENPADHATRGLTYDEFRGVQSEWDLGPIWARGWDLPGEGSLARRPGHLTWPHEYPIGEKFVGAGKEDVTDLEKCDKPLATRISRSCSAHVASIHRGPYGLAAGMFSSLIHLHRHTAVILRAVRAFRGLLQKEGGEGRGGALPKEQLDPEEQRRFILTAEDHRTVKWMWLQSVQAHHFPDTLRMLRGGRSSKLIDRLELFLHEDGLIRCGSRLLNSELPFGAKYPALLPGEEAYVNLVVLHSHNACGHLAARPTLARLRFDGYWIGERPGHHVYAILKGCLQCIKFRASPFQAPPFAPYPFDRVAIGKGVLFKLIGIDLCGPFFVRVPRFNEGGGERLHQRMLELTGTRSMEAESKLASLLPRQPTSKQKTWILLVTCLTTRAVCLQALPDYSGTSCILGLRRFIARYGVPATIFADNGGNLSFALAYFKDLTSQALLELPESEKLHRFVGELGIAIRRTPVKSPSAGGAWEGLIRICRHILKRTFGTKPMTQDLFLTALAEIEGMMNQRPLFWLGSHLLNGFLVTPASFMGTAHRLALPAHPDVAEEEEGDPTWLPSRLPQIFRDLEKSRNAFSKLVRKMIILHLQENYAYKFPSVRGEYKRAIKGDELVLVKDEEPGNLGVWKGWKGGGFRMARVVELLPKGRTAVIQYANGMRQTRHIRHLGPVEYFPDPDKVGKEGFPPNFPSLPPLPSNEEEEEGSEDGSDPEEQPFPTQPSSPGGRAGLRSHTRRNRAAGCRTPSPPPAPATSRRATSSPPTSTPPAGSSSSRRSSRSATPNSSPSPPSPPHPPLQQTTLRRTTANINIHTLSQSTGQVGPGAGGAGEGPEPIAPHSPTAVPPPDSVEKVLLSAHQNMIRDAYRKAEECEERKVREEDEMGGEVEDSEEFASLVVSDNASSTPILRRRSGRPYPPQPSSWTLFFTCALLWSAAAEARGAGDGHGASDVHPAIAHDRGPANTLPVGKRYQLCAENAHGGRPITLPSRPPACELPKPRHRQTKAQITLYAPTAQLPQVPAVKCYYETVKVWTSMSFWGGIGITGDNRGNLELRPAEIETCQEAWANGTFQGEKLVQVAEGALSSNLTLPISYSWCCFTKLNSVTNFILLFGTIGIGSKETLVSDLGSLNHCQLHQQKCRTDQYLVLWNETSVKDFCPFYLKGTYNGTINDDLVIIPSLQAALSLRKDRPLRQLKESCLPWNTRFSNEGPAVTVRDWKEAEALDGLLEPRGRKGEWRERRGRRRRGANSSAPGEGTPAGNLDEYELYAQLLRLFADSADPSNSKYHFFTSALEAAVSHQFSLLFTHFCELTRQTLALNIQLARLDPTRGVRALLGRDDIAATIYGDVLLVYQCREIEVTEVYADYRIPDVPKCWLYLPVKTRKHSFLFVSPGSRDLVTESPEMDCHLTRPALMDYSRAESMGEREWKTVTGHLHVTDINVLHGDYSNLTFSAPPLFQARLIQPGSAVGPLSLRLQALEKKVEATIVFASQLSLHPGAVRQALQSTGQLSGQVFDTLGSGLQGLWESIWGATVGLGKSMLSPALTVIGTCLGIAAAAAVALGFLYCIYQRILYRGCRSLIPCRFRSNRGEYKLAQANQPSLFSQPSGSRVVAPDDSWTTDFLDLPFASRSSTGLTGKQEETGSDETITELQGEQRVAAPDSQCSSRTCSTLSTFVQERRKERGRKAAKRAAPHNP